MTLYKKIVRVQCPEDVLANYKIKPGMEMVNHPYKPEEVKDVWDVMFRTSDMNPCLSERLLMEDIDNEVERLKFLYNGRTRDSDMHNKETFIAWQDFEDDPQLKDLDEFKSKASTQWGDPNEIKSLSRDQTLNEEYIKAKKKYVQLIDRG